MTLQTGKELMIADVAVQMEEAVKLAVQYLRAAECVMRCQQQQQMRRRLHLVMWPMSNPQDPDHGFDLATQLMWLARPSKG